MATSLIQRCIAAQQDAEDIDYGLRSIKECGGRWYCTGIHAGQVAKASAVAARLLGVETAAVLHAAGGHGCAAKLREAKALARDALKEAQAAKKELGGIKQIRLALAA